MPAVLFSKERGIRMQRFPAYRKLTDLTDREITFILNDIFHPEKIEHIDRDIENNTIDVDMTTLWGNPHDEDGVSEITDTITLTEHTIRLDFQPAAGDLHSYRQYMLAKGCNELLKNNQYLIEGEIQTMKVLIIDDSGMKRHDIINTLEGFGITDITEKEARNEGLRELLKSYESDNPYDLLILDMQFPVFPDGMPKPNMGIDVLHEIERKGWDIPVVMCSSDSTDLKDTFENVIADVQYDPMVSLTYKFEKIIDMLKSLKNTDKK